MPPQLPIEPTISHPESSVWTGRQRFTGGVEIDDNAGAVILQVDDNGVVTSLVVPASLSGPGTGPWNDPSRVAGALSGPTLTIPAPTAGSTFWANLGDAAAPGMPTLALGAGSALGIGAYRYQVSFTINGVETLSGAEATITTTTGNQAVSLSAIPLGPAGTSARKLYRSPVGGASGSEGLLATLADNTTSTFTDTTADASLGVAPPPVLLALPAPLPAAYFFYRLDQDAVGGRRVQLAPQPVVNDPTGNLNVQNAVLTGTGLRSEPNAVNAGLAISDGLTWYVYPETAGPPTLDQADQARNGLRVPMLRCAQVLLTSAGQALSGLPVIDGYQTLLSDPGNADSGPTRVLRNVSPADASNGLWVVGAGVWVRPSDYPSGGVVSARAVLVTGGNTTANHTLWMSLGTSTVVIDTNSSTWSTPLSPPVPVATPAVQGTVEVSATAANPANPIAVGDNDFRLKSPRPHGSAAGRMQTIGRVGLASGGQAITSGVIMCGFFTCDDATPITHLEFMLCRAFPNAADAVALGLVTLTNPDTATLSGTVAARTALTANNPALTAVMGGATGVVQLPLTANYTPTVGVRYGVLLLPVYGIGTAPNFGASSAGSQPNVFAPFFGCQAGSGQIDLPAVGGTISAPGGVQPTFSINGQNFAYWMGAKQGAGL